MFFVITVILASVLDFIMSVAFYTHDVLILDFALVLSKTVGDVMYLFCTYLITKRADRKERKYTSSGNT